MAALSAAVARRTRKVYSFVQNFRVDNAATIYVGAWCGLPGANALTSDRGYLVEWSDESTIIWAGMALGQSATNSLSTSNTVVGDTSATPVVEMAVECGPFILEQVAVTGVSAQADVARTAVYASNDNDLTTTASTYARRVGHVLYWHTSTTADVLFVGMIAHLTALL